MEKPEEVIREKDLKEQARERAVNQPIPAINTQDLETVKGPETQEVTENPGVGVVRADGGVLHEDGYIRYPNKPTLLGYD